MMYKHFNFLKKHTEWHLLTVRIDNENKFKNYCLKEFLQQHKITYELIVLYILN